MVFTLGMRTTNLASVSTATTLMTAAAATACYAAKEAQKLSSQPNCSFAADVTTIAKGKSLLPLEVRRALFQERGRSFFLVLGRA